MRSPTKDELVAIIAKAVPERAMSANHDVIGAARLDKDGEPTMWDVLDVGFFSDKQIVDWFVPMGRMAVVFAGKDHRGARKIMRNMLREDGNAMIADMFRDWAAVARRCSEMAEILKAAHNRALISLYVVAPDHPQDFDFL